jgi:Spy/CpxP family protein refolding chaperone
LPIPNTNPVNKEIPHMIGKDMFQRSIMERTTQGAETGEGGIARMVVISFFLLALVLATFQGSAESFPGKQKSPGEIVAKLKERLNLTEEQEAKIRPIVEEHLKWKQERFEEMKKQREAFRASITEVLTDEQKAEYKKYQEEKMKKHREKCETEKKDKKE